MSDNPLANADFGVNVELTANVGVVVEPMADDVVTARLRIEVARNVELQLTSEPRVPVAVVEPTTDVVLASEPGVAPANFESTTDVAPADLGVVVEPMADVVTARLRFGIPLAVRLSKVGVP